jgi:hypothetical protein
MSKRLNDLQAKIVMCQDELDNLHMFEPNETWYRIRRHELESKIAMLESIVDNVQHEERMMRPLKYMLYGFIGVSILLLLLAYVNSK